MAMVSRVSCCLLLAFSAWPLCGGIKVLESQNSTLLVPGLPTCQGKALPNVVGDDHWQCDSLSGAKGAAAEKKCRESYDTDSKAQTHLQCAVSYRNSQNFNCLATTPCEAPKNVLEIWNDLKPLGDDVPMKRMWMKLEGTRLIHVADYQMMAALGPSKALVCGAIEGTQNDYCQVVEVKDGKLQTGERIATDAFADVWAEKASNDKVLYCGRKSGSMVNCFPLVADGMKLSRGATFSVPKRKAEITMTFMASLAQLGENRLLLCFNERFDWSKHHALSCTVVEEKDGAWSLGPLNVMVEEKANAEAYMMAHTIFLAPDKVLMCYKGKQSEKFAKCGTVQVAGTTVTWAGDQLQIAHGDWNPYRIQLDPLTSNRAMLCNVRAHCWLLGIAGTTVSQISDFNIPKSALEDRVGWLARLWSDRLVYCALRSGGHGPYASPLCYQIKCREDVCAFGEASTVNGLEGKEVPLSAHTQVVQLGPGKVLSCTDDRGQVHITNRRAKPEPVCALFYLEGQL